MSVPSKEDGAETVAPPAAKTTAAARTAAAAEATAKPAQNATFTNTRQHVADRQKASVATERFANTKQNIALISDPKNGPRFTLTRKEAGQLEKSGAEPAPLVAEKPARDPATTSKPVDKPTDVVKPKAEEKTVEVATAPEQKAPSTGSAKTGESKASETRDSESKDSRTTARKAEESTKQQAAVSTAKRPNGPIGGSLGVPPAAKPPDKVPVDSSKTFVGPNGTYYDEAWRWMDWRGVKRSWNWPAFLSLGHWFAYRRLYGHAGVVVVWLMSLAAALVNNLHVGLVAGLLMLSLILVGLYANTLYFLVFRRAVAHVTEEGEGSYDELRQQLAEAGGVNLKAPCYMVALTIMGIGLALGLTLFARGTFLINIWPF